MAAFLKFWREAIIGVLVIALFVVWLLYRHQVHAFERYRIDSAAAYAEALNAERARLAHEQSVTNEVANDLRAKLDALEHRPAVTTPVRLCRPAADRGGVSLPQPTGGGHGSAAGAVDGGTHGGDLAAGPDIGPELRDFAKDCESYRLRLQGIQTWTKAVGR